MEQPWAEVAHLEAVLLDAAAYWVAPATWSGPQDQGEDYDRGWTAACDAVQAGLRGQLERVVAGRRHLAQHEGPGDPADQTGACGARRAPGAAGREQGLCREES